MEQVGTVYQERTAQEKNTREIWLDLINTARLRRKKFI